MQRGETVPHPSGGRNKQRSGSAFHRLPVVTPPVTLGDLRRLFSKEIERRIVPEAQMDLTNVCDHAIGEPVEKVLAISGCRPPGGARRG